MLGALLFVVYNNDLSRNLHSNLKRFVDDTSISYTVTDTAISNSYLDNTLNNWVYDWKMSFNNDSTKSAHNLFQPNTK